MKSQAPDLPPLGHTNPDDVRETTPQVGPTARLAGRPRSLIRHNVLADRKAAADYVAGIWRLKDPDIFPWPGRDGLSRYDSFVSWHLQAMARRTPPSQSRRNAAHSGPAFLPWHRYLLLRFESLLRQALDANDFQLPYWDWAADAELDGPTQSRLWHAELLGQFENSTWNVRLERHPGDGSDLVVDGRRLRRALGAQASLPSRSEVRAVVSDETVYDSPPYDRSAAGARNRIELLHNRVHVWVGGDMASSISPNDPAFYLHHANVDRIWSAWSRRHPNAGYRPLQTETEDLLLHRIDDRMHTDSGEKVTPRMMLDHSARYEYDTVDDLTGE